MDEIIVVDTGSTDRTKVVAQSYGAKVYDFAWIGDFSAARNEALKYATGDWIIFLDADEYFTQETRGNLRMAIAGQADKEALVVKLINLDVEDDEDKEIDGTFVLRIFQRKPELYYERRIHEYLKKDASEKLKLGAIPANVLLIYHTGYTPSRSGQKSQRNLALLLEELKVSPEPENLYRYLAEAYDGLGETEKAIHYAEIDIADGPKEIAYASRCYRLLLLRLNDENKRREVLQKAIKAFPLMPEFHAEEAEYLAEELNYEQAVSEMEKAIKLYDTHVEDGESMQFDNSMREQAAGQIKSWKALLHKAAELTISSCLMVRDGADDIARWLDCAQEYSDEILILDTGSSDETLAICRQKGYEPMVMDWQDDFSAGRNLVLERAKNNWIIFLDVDEYFFEPHKVRKLLAKAELQMPQAEGILLPLVNIDEDAYDCEISRMEALRIWRNRPLYRYEGAIHEALYQQGQPLRGLVRTNQLKIMHTGYSTQRVRAKLERNLRMLLKEIELHGEQPIYDRYLADCCYGLKEYELSAHYAQKALASGTKTLAGDGDLYHLWDHSLAELGRGPAECYAVVAQGRKNVPDDKGLQAREGLLLCQMGNKTQGRQVLERVVKENMASRMPSTSADMLQAVCQLAEIKIEEGQLAAARNLLHWVLGEYPGHDAALDVYALLLYKQGMKTPEVADRLQQEISLKKDWVAWAFKMGQLRLVAYWAKTQETEQYPEVLGKDWGEIEEAAALRVACHIQDLFMEILAIKTGTDKICMDWIDEWCNILPDSLHPVIQRYYGRRERLEEKDEEAYMTGWNILLSRPQTPAMAAYSELATDFSEQFQLRIADDLWQRQEWEAAIHLYQGLSQAGIAEQQAEFWYHLGVALYQQQEIPEIVLECLHKAEKHGCREKALSAYLQWTKERIKS